MAQAKADPAPARANLPFRLLRHVGRTLFRALFSVEIEGLDRVPAAGPYVLACNHLSWFDPMLLLAYLPAEPRIHYLAAAEYTVDGPWIARYIVSKTGGVIPIDRQGHKGDRAAVVQALKVLRGGGVLGIFPEGKCGFVEGEIQPLKEGAATFAAKTGSPILVTGMSGTTELYFRRRIRIRIGPLLQPREGETQESLLARVAEAMAETVPPLSPNQPKVKRMAWLSRLF
jgi:1-acyl-sn-glycerol-3-phosphate acyltransferase